MANLGQNYRVNGTEKRLSELSQMLAKSPVGSVEFRKFESALIEHRSDPEQIQAMLVYLKLGKAIEKNLLFVAIEIKNAIIDSYHLFDQNRKSVNDSFLVNFRSQLLELYFLPELFSGSERVFATISSAVKLIVSKEFPVHWPELIDLLAARLSPDNHSQNRLIFALLKHITKEYPSRITSEEHQEELLLVTSKFHGILADFCQGYIGYLQSNAVSPRVSLKIIGFILRIYANLISQNGEDTLETGGASWAQMLRPLFSAELNAAIGAQIEQEYSKIAKNTQDSRNETNLMKGWFDCKGEAVKVLTLMASRCDEELSAEVDNFTDVIWKNCLEHASSRESGKSHLLIHSLKYFRSLTAGRKYMEFFEKNLTDILLKLVIPALSGDNESMELYESDPEAFVESLLVVKNFENKKKLVIHDFVSALARFHRDGVFAVLEAMFSELLANRSINNAINETLFMAIFYDSALISFNDSGATAISCPLGFLNYIFQNLVEQIVNDFAENATSLDKATQFKSAFLICHYLQFARMFSNLIGYERVSMLIFKLFCMTISVPIEPYQKTLIEMVGFMLKTRSFVIEDKMNTDVSQLTFYQRYFNNPQRISVRQSDNTLMFKIDSQIDIFNVLLEGLLWYMSQKTEHVDHRSLRVLKTALEVIGDKHLSRFQNQLLPFVQASIQNLKLKKLALNFIVVNGLFDILAGLIVKSQTGMQGHLHNIVSFVAQMISPDSLELTALIFQTVALFISKFRVNMSSDLALSFRPLLLQALDPRSYNQKTIGIFFAYFTLIQEAIRMEPQILAQRFSDIKSILCEVNNLLQLKITYQFLKFLTINKLPIDQLIPMSVTSLETFYSCINSHNLEAQKFVFMKPMILKEFFEFVFISSVTESFSAFYNRLKISGVDKKFGAILTNDDSFTFLSQNCSRFFRQFTLFALSRMLFDEYKFFTSNGLANEYNCLLNSTLENIWRTKFDSRSLRTNYEAHKLENEKFNEITDSNFTAIYRLRELPESSEEFMSNFRKNLNYKHSGEVYFVEAFKNFLLHNNLHAGNVVGDQKYLRLIN